MAPTHAAHALFGPGKVTIRSEDGALDLDSPSPTPSSGDRGADISVIFNSGAPSIVTPTSSFTLATLPNQGAEPTAGDCAESIRKTGSYAISSVATGSRFCVMTDEGRSAYVRVTTTGISLSPVHLTVTVWELPS